ncbi:MAG: sigma-70 family RNA polymerase sigma factor [Planctomycetota bacterium]
MITKTSTLLLENLKDPRNNAAWGEFDARYRPVLESFARGLGLGEIDAEELTQETLTRFVMAFREGRYSRSRGRLRSWIFGIAKTCCRDLSRRRARRREERGQSHIEDALDDSSLESSFDVEWQRAIVRTAMDELKDTTRMDEKTIRVFTELALEEKSAADLARELSMTPSAVYVAKHRAITRLREIIARLREEF